MPYSGPTPTLTLCEQLAGEVRAAWGPTGDDAVDWAFFVRWGDADGQGAPPLAGRQVRLFPTRYDREAGTRENNEHTHEVTCLVAERYTGPAGDPSKEWVAERVDFVTQRIVNGLWFVQDGAPPWNPRLTTLGVSVEVLDVAKLVGSGRLFYAVVELRFFELVF